MPGKSKFIQIIDKIHMFCQKSNNSKILQILNDYLEISEN